MTLPLDKMVMGQSGRIHRLPEGTVRSQAIRFGLCEGAEIVCYQRIVRGPVVIRRGQQHLAIGNALAGEILVEIQEAS